jgi:pimeloyl-ACP methyl ester carboxylesterase
VALVGFSEGGWVAPMAAAREDGVRAIASISGGAFTKGDSYLHKNRLAFQEQGLAGAALDSAMAVERAVVDSARVRTAAGRGSGFERRISYDAAAEWRAFRGPVLYLLGELDVLEPAERSAARMRENLAAAGNPDVVVHVFPRAHHSLWVGRTGLPSEWRSLAFDRYAPGYWPTLLAWLDTRLAP